MTSKRATLLAVVLGSGIVFLDSSIVPVALPRIGRELPSLWLGTLEGQSYVYYGYLLTLSSLLVLAGALIDYHGRRRLFSVGLVGFGVTSLLCGVAPNLELLVIARILQGAAGAILVPGSLAIITATFEGEEQGRAYGIWAGASAATTILGPLVGGAFVAYISWRAAFLVNLPLIAWALWATVTRMGETRAEDASGRVDWLGAAIMAVAVGGLTFGAIRGQSQEWQDPVAYVCLVLGGAAAVAFPFAMARSSHPLVPLELFKSRNFSVTNVSTLLIYGAIYVVFQLSALFLIGVLGYNEMGFGAVTIPSDLFLALFSARIGRLADRHGPRLFMAVGPALMGLALLWFVRIPATSAPWRLEPGGAGGILPPADVWVDVLPVFTLFGIGLMIMVAPLTAALMRSVPVSHSGVASAFNNAVSRVGPQLGGALLFIVITSSFYARLQSVLGGAAVAGLRDRVSPLNAVSGVGPRVAAAAQAASTDAFQLAMAAAALMCFVGALVNALWIRNPSPEPARPAIAPCRQTPAVESPTGGSSTSA